MNIKIYTDFSKRTNSTKLPASNVGTEVAVKLKEGTSIYNPSFILSSGGNKPQIKYVKWDSYYYYVNDVTITTDHLYQIDCTIDVLASFKSDILNTSAFVKYSTSNYDLGISDLRLSTKDERKISTNSVQPSYTGLPEHYMVSFIGDHTGVNPVVGLNESGVKALATAIQSNGFAELFTDPSSAISKMLTDTSSAVTYCRYIPYGQTTGGTEIVLAGGYDVGFGGGTPLIYTATDTISIPWNFNSGDFRNRSQYSHLILYLGIYGAVDLNVDDFIGKTSISIKTILDSSTGDINFIVDNRMAFKSKIGHDVQLGTTTSGSLGNALASTTAMVGSAMSGNVIGTAVSGFNVVTSAFGTTPSSIGSVGGNADEHIFRLVMISHDTSESPSDMANIYGRPLNQVKALSGLTGYVECTNASVNTTAPKNIKDEINTYLNGGVYIY